MAIIDQRDDVFTLINVFTVKQENQDTLVTLLTEATNNTMRRLPGFVSASIHKSLDNTRVVNYAQWRSKDDFDAMRTNPEAIPHMKAAAALASFDPIACEVSESIAR
jgi:quinol monooxygenase YgiN